MRVAIWHEGGLGDVVDAAHLGTALRRARPDIDCLALYIRRELQSELAAALCHKGKPVFDVILIAGRGWEDNLISEAGKWDRYIDWRPYAAMEYLSIREPTKLAHMRALLIDHHIPDRWLATYNAGLQPPWTYLMQFDGMTVHEIGCKSLEIPPVPISHLTARPPDKVARRLRLLTRTPYITLGTGSDTQTGTRTPQTKEYPPELWAEVLVLLRKHPPISKYPILQVGKKGEAAVKGAMSLAGKTSIPELLYVLERSTFHLSVENGTVRIAKACGTNSVVLYGPTASSLYHLEGNTAIEGTVCEPCMWRTPRWMVDCANGWDGICMKDHNPKDIAAQIIHAFEKELHQRTAATTPKVGGPSRHAREAYRKEA